jgi:hypothetical protein
VGAEIQLARARILGTVHRPRGRARATRLGRCTDGQGRPLRQRELCGRHADRLKANRPNLHELGAFLTGRAARTVSQELDASGFRVQDLCMIGATVVISRAQLRTSHDTVVGFLRGAGCAIRARACQTFRCFRVAIEEKSWFNESTEAAVLVTEIADHIASSASVRPALEAIINLEG